jgi:hypothetical protein
MVICGEMCCLLEVFLRVGYSLPWQLSEYGAYTYTLNSMSYLYGLSTKLIDHSHSVPKIIFNEY